MPDFVALVSSFIYRAQLIVPGDRIGVAVSGGADSVCLLRVLHHLRCTLHVIHINHHLRGVDSDADAAFVQQLAVQLGLPCTIYHAKLDPQAGNLEEAARDARRAFFAEARIRFQLTCIATGHTKDDQAETVLFRFLRGAGSTGLAGISPKTADRLVRPLLERSRSDVEAYLDSMNQIWRTDSTNAEPQFARNRIRHQLLPQLLQEWNPALVDTLSSNATLFQVEESYWGRNISALAADLFTVEAGCVLIPVAGLRAQDVAVARRLLRWAFQHVKGDLRRIEDTHVECVLKLASRPDGNGRFQAPGLEVLRSFDWIRITNSAPGNEAGQFVQVSAPAPGEYSTPGGNSRILLETETYQAGERTRYTGAWADRIDRDTCSHPLVIRSWRPGDRFFVAGVGLKKLKLLFQESRIPLWERKFWPILDSGGSIVWMRRFGVAAPHAATDASNQVWRIAELLV